MPKALSSWLQRELFHPPSGYTTVLDPIGSMLSFIHPRPFDFDSVEVARVLQPALTQAASEGFVPVITSESLIGNPNTGGANSVEIATRLHATLADAAILLVIREQQAMLRSLYKTFIMYGRPHSLPALLDPVGEYELPPFDLDFLRYDQPVEHYRRLFGKDRVLVVPYELFQTDPGAFLDHLARFTGASHAAQLPVGRVVNANAPLVHLERERLRNCLTEGGPYNYLGLRRQTEERRIARIRRTARRGPPRLLAPLDRRLERRFAARSEAAIGDRFRSGNAWLSELTGFDLASFGYLT